MSRQITDAELAVSKPDESEPFQTIPGTGIQSVSVRERVQDAMDDGTITITNHGGEYTYPDRITSGDKLTFRVRLTADDSLTDYWTAVVRDTSHVLPGGGGTRRLELDATDFVFTVLSWRLAYATFDSAPISGSSDAIIDTLLADLAPEIDTSQLAAVDGGTDGFYNGRSLYSIITEDLAPVADAIVAQDGTSLVFDPLSDADTKHVLGLDDFRGEVTIGRRDDTVANLVRVDGGTDHVADVEQPTQSDSTRVTNSSRVTAQIRTRKSEVDRVLVHTIPDSGSMDGLSVRLQADRDGSPVAVDDQTSDITRTSIPVGQLEDDDLTTFVLPAHTLAPQDYPWLIIEATGSSGHDIGTDGSGVPTYRTEYPFPLLARIPDSASQDEYRRRDHRIKDDSLDSFGAVSDKARSYLRHHDEPDISISGEAESVRAHELRPGEVVDIPGFSARGVDVTGQWIVVSRETTFNGSSNRLETILELQETGSF